MRCSLPRHLQSGAVYSGEPRRALHRRSLPGACDGWRTRGARAPADSPGLRCLHFSSAADRPVVVEEVDGAVSALVLPAKVARVGAGSAPISPPSPCRIQYELAATSPRPVEIEAGAAVEDQELVAGRSCAARSAASRGDERVLRGRDADAPPRPLGEARRGLRRAGASCWLELEADGDPSTATSADQRQPRRAGRTRAAPDASSPSRGTGPLASIAGKDPPAAWMYPAELVYAAMAPASSAGAQIQTSSLAPSARRSAGTNK